MVKFSEQAMPAVNTFQGNRNIKNSKTFGLGKLVYISVCALMIKLKFSEPKIS